MGQVDFCTTCNLCNWAKCKNELLPGTNTHASHNNGICLVNVCCNEIKCTFKVDIRYPGPGYMCHNSLVKCMVHIR